MQTLEELFEQIDTIVQELENPEIPIEEAFTKYEAGMKLLKGCNDKIDMIEKKVQEIGADGELRNFQE